MKFVPGWPYISRMRICFAGAPYVSLAVKPIINFGVDVAELPGIAGWLVRRGGRLPLSGRKGERGGKK